MKQKTVYTDKQPAYLYQVYDGVVDIVLNEFIEEVIDKSMETPQTMYIYNSNFIKCSCNEITEQMIKDNFDYYLNYSKPADESLEKQIMQLKEENQLLQNCILELSEVVYSG